MHGARCRQQLVDRADGRVKIARLTSTPPAVAPETITGSVRMSRWRVVAALTGILVVYGIVYWPARDFGFVWADFDAIRDSAVYDLPLGRELRTTEHARMNPSVVEVRGVALAHEAYRPLLILSHGLDIRLFGRVPGPMHVENILLGALGVLAAFWLALRLLGAAATALWLTAIFAWHPLQVEPICFLSARGDPLAGLLALVATALVVEIAPAAGAPRRRAVTGALAVAAGLFMLASLFTKEANLLLPLALGGFALATGRLRPWRAGLVAMAAAVPAYAALRALLLPHAPSATHAERITQAAVALPAIALEYARSFVLPFDLSIARPLYVPIALGWAVLALAAVAIGAGVRRATTGSGPLELVAAGLGWAGLLLAPSAIAVFSEVALADRYMYLPLFGFAVAVVAPATRLAARGRAWRRGLVAAGALYLGLCLFVSAREVPAWASNGALFAHAVDVEPESPVAHNHLGRWYCEQGAWQAAVPELERAVALPGAGDRVADNLGVAYLNVGRLADAETTLRRALAMSGDTSFHVWYNLGTAQRLRGDVAAACASWRQALQINPEYGRAQADVARYCR
jgi:tetratricopeptide (TPR) repeat protein